MEALLVTPAEAAAITKLSRSRIYLEIASGRLESITVGRSRRIRTSALVTWTERLAREQFDANKPASGEE